MAGRGAARSSRLSAGDSSNSRIYWATNHSCWVLTGNMAQRSVPRPTPLPGMNQHSSVSGTVYSQRLSHSPSARRV